MHEHDRELIAALVEGRLDDESEARALISSSAELREEYEAQKIAYEALRSTIPAKLSESERSALHRDVWTALRAETASRRTPWYSRLAPVAAGLLVVIGVATVFLPGGQDSGGDEAAAPLSADSSTSASTSIAAESGGGEADIDDGETLETTAQSGEEAPADGAAAFSSQAARVREGDFDEGDLETFSYTRTSNAPEIEECVDAAGLLGFRVVATLSETPTPQESATDSTTTTVPAEAAIAVAIPEDADLGTAPVAFVDLGTCEVVYTDE
jgi:hypothetical protein